MEERPRTPNAQAYAANLQHTLKELQRHVEEHQDKLNELRSKQWQLPQTPTGQIQILTTAFDELTNSEPFLPHPGSVLPALLALRKTHQTIVESRAFLASQNEVSEKGKRQLEADKAALGDHRLIKQALAARIASLQDEVASEAEYSQSEDVSKRRVEELQDKKKHYSLETSRLMKALNKFINDHLAAMLAAEELGGPVVGDWVDIDAEDLAFGFSSQGKLKRKAKDDDATSDQRQRRIDEIWGPAADQQQQQQQRRRQQEGRARQTGEVDAAATEMRQLTEELLNRLVEARGSNSESYVQLSRESAAARFLIRSKVAEFHPKDATRIRLIDFGRELEGW